MGYIRADEVLPIELIKMIQEYVDGECLYIPRAENERRAWGDNTKIKQELMVRNENIYRDYKNGIRIRVLAEKYFLSEKSIQRIVRQMKKIA